VVAKGSIFWDTMLCNTSEFKDVSEERIASIFRVERISEIGTLARNGDFILQNHRRENLKTNLSPLSSVFTPAIKLISCSAHSTLKMEAICYSETQADLQRTIRRNIAEVLLLTGSLQCKIFYQF
jgi:hypothetical protein